MYLCLEIYAWIVSEAEIHLLIKNKNSIRMSHWRCQVTEGAEFWISCKQPAFLSNSSHLQLIQNSVPSVARRRQCAIQILSHWHSSISRFERQTFWQGAPSTDPVSKHFSVSVILLELGSVTIIERNIIKFEWSFRN